MPTANRDLEKLKELMRLNGVSQHELAERMRKMGLKTTQATISRRFASGDWPISEYKAALAALGANENAISGDTDAAIAGGIIGIKLDKGTRQRLENAARRYGLIDEKGKPDLANMIKVFMAQGLATHEASFSDKHK
jgi:transcriptional regulator with XRE-family HTH domain